VGVGQQEIEISKFSDCVVLVLSPEGGDSIQMLKAGILEAADIIVVNKYDRPNADRFIMEVESSIRLTRKNDTIITKAAASKGEGVGELFKTITDFISSQTDRGEFASRRLQILKNRIRRSCEEYLSQSFQRHSGLEEKLEKSARIIMDKKEGLYDEVRRILEEFYGTKTGPGKA
jgi:LAO/AO transport system kinase